MFLSIFQGGLKMIRAALAATLFLFITGPAHAMPQNLSGVHAATSQLHSQALDEFPLPASNFQYLIIAKGPKHKGGGHPGKGKHGGGTPGESGHPGKGHGKGGPFANSSLPAWAHDCGLPPGLAKQNKVPPGWEKKCRSGLKYYDHKAEFREEVYRGRTGPITQESPLYQTIYEMDDAACKVKSISSVGDIAEGAVKGAVFGGIIGAAGGAIYGGATDANVKNSAITGGTSGAIGGAVLGGILASNDYKSRYRQCMNKRGHRVH